MAGQGDRPAAPQTSPRGDNVPEIEEALLAAIRADEDKRITFARFMEICLYHPTHGYYASFGPREVDGAKAPAADYVTSVDLHPAFGRLLAREVAIHLERALPRGRKPVWVVEMGAGRGLLARDVLQALLLERPDLSNRVRYLIVEPHAGWMAIQRRNLLPEFEGRVEWVRSSGTVLPLRDIRGVILSNELFDALPFHRLVGRSGLSELFVEAGSGGEFREVAHPVSDFGLGTMLSRHGVTLADGQVGEVSLASEALAASMADALHRGAIIVVDYGDEAQALYDANRRPEGTMRCFFRHRLSAEPFQHLGLQDITAHVNFTSLSGVWWSRRLEEQRLERQREFLLRHGLEGLMVQLEGDRDRLPREKYLRHKRAMEALANEAGLGGNLVLVACKQPKGARALEAPWAHARAGPVRAARRR